jgi:DNA-binding transcriptional regulator YiaG
MAPRDVRRLRSRLGWTQAQLAAWLGLRGRSQVSHLESGRTPASGSRLELLRRLAALPPGAASPPAAPDAPATARQVKALRRRLGLSQAGLARALGLSSPTTVCQWEAGAKAPAGPTLRLLRLLGG